MTSSEGGLAPRPALPMMWYLQHSEVRIYYVDVVVVVVVVVVTCRNRRVERGGPWQGWQV